MRLKLCFLTGILLFSALFFISVAHAGVLPAKYNDNASRVIYYVYYPEFASSVDSICSLYTPGTYQGLSGCWRGNSFYGNAWLSSHSHSTTCGAVPIGPIRASSNYKALCSGEYSCPPDPDHLDYSVLSDIDGNPSSSGQFCAYVDPNPCNKLKGVNNVLQVTQYFISKTGGSPACENGCEMTRVGTQWEYWQNESGVPMASASYVYSGNQCDNDYNYRETAPVSSAQPSNPSSATSSAEPTNPSSATSSAEPANPSSGESTNPSDSSSTDSGSTTPSNSTPTSGGGATGGGGGGSGGGSGSGSGTPSSSATDTDPAASSGLAFTAPTGSKDYLKDVFSSDAVKSVQSQRDAMLVKINDKMAQIKALTNINNISVSGDLSPDVKSVRGNDVDFSGKDILSKFSISWVFYFITALWCMDIILNRRKK